MLGVYRALCVINMILFILCFLVLINKKGYVYKIKINISFIVIAILTIMFTIIGIPFGVVKLPILIPAILLLFLICKVLHKRSTIESIITSLIYSLVYVLIQCSLYWFLTIKFIFKGHYLYVTDLVINFLIIFSGVWYYHKLKEFYNNKKYFIYISLTMVVNILIILFLKISVAKISDLYNIVIKNNLEYNNLEYNNIVDAVMISGFMGNVFPYIIVIINIILISIFINSIKSEKEKEKLEFVNEKLDMQYKYYEIIKESQEKMKQVYHDMNNHMENIKALKNSSEDVNKYINNVEDEVKSSKSIYNSGNVLLDIILHEKSKECMTNYIDFNVAIDFSKCEFIDRIDISSIFSNLIDNGIEACNKIDDSEIKKYITIKSTFIKGYYVVRCENSKINKVVSKNNKIFTSKKDKFLHGIGLESIKSSINKYNGELKIKDSEYKFIATIHIPVE